MKLFLSYKQKTTYYNRNSWSFSSLGANLTNIITWRSNCVIYNLFTCDVSFPLWRHYLVWQCEVINVKNFNEVLRYFFQVLAPPPPPPPLAYSHVLTIHEVIRRINQLKRICFPKVRETVELISCQNSDTICLMCVPKELSVFSINL